MATKITTGDVAPVVWRAFAEHPMQSVTTCQNLAYRTLSLSKRLLKMRVQLRCIPTVI